MREYREYAKVFKALGDPKRAMIVDMLSCCQWSFEKQYFWSQKNQQFWP